MMRRTLAGMAAALAIVPVAAADADAAKKKGKSVTVMTRNLYLGGDITRPLDAVKGKSGLDALYAFGNANRELRAIVDQTSFPTRSKRLAREILTRKPDLVGLQEVALWRSGPFEPGNIGKATATSVDYDFLTTLLKDLKGRYNAVVIQKESDVEGPVINGTDLENATAARLTMRDVILRRKASKVRITKKGSKQYTNRLDVDLSGVTFSFIRGYQFVDAKLGKRKFRFINTHLESETSTLALDQAKEALAGPVKAARKKKTVIFVCDCNSDPEDTSVKPYDIPHESAYNELMRTFHDQWVRWKPGGPGFTSGFSELVNDPDTSAIDHRIDLILARTKKGKALKTQRAWIVGTNPKQRTAAGLWPSDHAGVVAKLRLP